MAQTINTNVISLNSQRHLSSSQADLSKSIERLSSGLRVNSARDDAAGLAIASRMEAQIRGSDVAIRNANDAISLAQTAEGALSEVGNMLQRMRELAVQSANGTNSTSDREILDAEYQALDTEILRLSTATQFNGVQILSADTTTTFQIGANNGDQLKLETTELKQIKGDIKDATNAGTALKDIDDAINDIATARAALGASSSNFSSVINNLQIMSESTSAARGRIMDADFAVETANMTRASILQQAGTAMVAQANQLPNNVLSLLR